MKNTFIIKNKQMSRQQNQHNGCTYVERQDHSYDTHKELQELNAHIGFIRIRLIRNSSTLLDARLNATHIYQTEAFGSAHRDLNNSIHQVVNLNHDLGEFKELLVPFNTPPSPSSSSASSLTVSEAPSYANESQGGLIDNSNE